MYRYKSIDISIFIDMNQSSGYLVYFWVSRGRSVRLITQLPLSAVAESKWRYEYVFTPHLRKYIFVKWSYFAQSNIHLAGVA
jgi:hypothetical protein